MAVSLQSTEKIPLVVCLCALLCSVPASLADEGVGTVHVPNSIDDGNLYSVALPDLDGSGFLRGTAADVTNSLTGRAHSDTLEFNYDPTAGGESRIHFVETMVYYHMSATKAHVASLGLPVPDFQMAATVYAARSMGPIMVPVPTEYDYDTRDMRFSATMDMSNSDALDGDVIVHEYAHAIQHQILGGIPGQFTATETTPSEQARALMEGLADYLAASRFSDPEIGEVQAQIWGLGLAPRNVNNSRRWPDDFVEGGPHETGLIFSGALWDLRATVGAEVADRLSLELIQLLPDNNSTTPELNTTFFDAFDAIVQVDGATYGGGHKTEIWDALASHGITGPLPGDADRNGFVDDDDLSRLLANWGLDTDWPGGEFIGDHIVDDNDLSLLLANWNGGAGPPESGAAPEPGTVMLLAAGACISLVRRRT